MSQQQFNSQRVQVTCPPINYVVIVWLFIMSYTLVWCEQWRTWRIRCLGFQFFVLHFTSYVRYALQKRSYNDMGMIVYNELYTSVAWTMAHMTDSVSRISVLCIAFHVVRTIRLTETELQWYGHDNVYNRNIFTKAPPWWGVWAVQCKHNWKLTMRGGHS